MADGILLESIEGLGESPLVGTAGEIWESLQSEKEAVSRELLADWPLLHAEAGARQQSDAADEVEREIEWLHRSQLEMRLRKIVEAQDRLLDGAYGGCVDCGEKIEPKRLAADPAASLCLTCQQFVDRTPKVGVSPVNRYSLSR